MVVSDSMGHGFEAHWPRQQAHGWRHCLFRMVPAGIVYRMAAWRRSRGAENGQLVVVEHRRGRVRLRYSSSHEGDVVEWLRLQGGALAVAERCGGQRCPLRGDGCLAERQPACVYTLSWAGAAGPAPALIAGLVAAVGLFAASYRATMPASGWILLPIAAAVAHVLERRRVARANVAAEAEAGAGFRWLLEQALGARLEASADAEATTPASPVGASPSLEKQGEFWRIAYGGTTVLLRHSRGLALLAHLVRCPGRDIHVRELDSITPSG